MSKSKESTLTAGKIIWGILGLATVGLAAVVTLGLIKGEGPVKDVLDHWLKERPATAPNEKEA
jgi:hypothetical protein